MPLAGKRKWKQVQIDWAGLVIENGCFVPNVGLKEYGS